MRKFTGHLGIAAAFAVAAMAGASGANAATLTFFGSTSAAPPGPNIFYDAADDRAQLICSLGCEGLLSDLASGNFPNSADVPDPSTADGFSNTAADLFDLANSSDAGELAFVNAIVNPDFLSGVKTDTGGVDTKQFVSNAEYILIKIGADPNYALIHNLRAGNIFDFSAFSGEGAGLSHYTEFGTAQIIPLPASMLLLFSGLGGLGFLGWRRRIAVA